MRTAANDALLQWPLKAVNTIMVGGSASEQQHATVA
jgi:hypothetical protein